MGQDGGVSLDPFVALMKEHGEAAAEDATWKASIVSRG